jgi:hypothetical protein
MFTEIARQLTSAGFAKPAVAAPFYPLPPGLGKRAAMLFLGDGRGETRFFRFFSILGGAVSAAVRAGGG